MVCEPRTVERPIEFRRAFQIEVGLSAQRWDRPHPDLPAWAGWLANPKHDQGASGRESESPDRGIDEFRSASASQVMELSRTGLCDPDVGMSHNPVRDS